MRHVMMTGSRGWTDGELIEDVFREWAYEELAPGEGVTLIHGGAGGADTLAGEAADRLGWLEEIHRPNWKKYGKAAGFIRNETMLDRNPEAVFVFWDGESRGTHHAMNSAETRGIPTILTTDD